MGFFNWAAPIMRHYGDRFTLEDATSIAGALRPAVPPGGAVLDVGGGSGQLAALLAEELDAHVTVLDPSPRMLAYVQDSTRVVALSGSAERIPARDGAFDALVVTDAFHHFRDQTAALAEFARVVRPGGAVLVDDYDRRSLAMRIIGLGERIVGEAASFVAPDAMCALMASAAIDGTCTPGRGAAYRFVGRVRA